jgi:hypothetical protein
MRKSRCPICGSESKAVTCGERDVEIGGETVSFCMFYFDCKACGNGWTDRPEIQVWCCREEGREKDYRFTTYRKIGSSVCEDG